MHLNIALCICICIISSTMVSAASSSYPDVQIPKLTRFNRAVLSRYGKRSYPEANLFDSENGIVGFLLFFFFSFDLKKIL